MTDKSLTKTISFDQVMKIMQKYVSKSDKRPSLKYVYNDGKYLVATNSHVLIKFNKNYITDIPVEYEERCLFDPQTMENKGNEMNYPEVNRLIPTFSESVVSLNNKNIKEFQEQIKAAKKRFKKRSNNHFKLDFTKANLVITAYEKGNWEFEELYTNTIESVQCEGKELTLRVNTQYLNNTLDVVKKLSKLNNYQTELRMVSSLKPLHFTQYDLFDILVLPIRVY
jgi:DNA polymerase III beta subunit, C-terminal domain